MKKNKKTRGLMLGQQKQLSGMHLTLRYASTRCNATPGVFASFFFLLVSARRSYHFHVQRHIVKITNAKELRSGALLAHCYFEATENNCAIDQLKHGLKSMGPILTI